MGACLNKMCGGESGRMERLEENQRDLIIMLKDSGFREYEYRRIIRYHACLRPPVPPRRVVKFKTFGPANQGLSGTEGYGRAVRESMQ